MSKKTTGIVSSSPMAWPHTFASMQQALDSCSESYLREREISTALIRQREVLEKALREICSVVGSRKNKVPEDTAVFIDGLAQDALSVLED